MNDRPILSASTIRTGLAFLVVLVFILALPLAIQIGRRLVLGERVLDAQPEGLPLGTVQVGSIVEANVRGVANESGAAGLVPSITTPEFAQLMRSHFGPQTIGVHRKPTLEAWIQIDTSVPGVYSGPLLFELGDYYVEVPVTVTVVPAVPTAPRVLMVPTPFSSMSTDDPASYAAWTKFVEIAGVNMSYLTIDRTQPVLRDLDLSNFDVIVLADDAVYFAQDDDFERLQEFAERGGRVVVAANCYMTKTVEQANRLLIPNGMRIEDIESPAGCVSEIDSDQILTTPWTEGVQQLRMFRPSPITVVDESQAQLLVSAPPYPGQGFVAVATVGDGEIVAIGKTLLWDWISDDDVYMTDNAVLLQNLLMLPIGGDSVEGQR